MGVAELYSRANGTSAAEAATNFFLSVLSFSFASSVLSFHSLSNFKVDCMHENEKSKSSEN